MSGWPSSPGGDGSDVIGHARTPEHDHSGTGHLSNQMDREGQSLTRLKSMRGNTMRQVKGQKGHCALLSQSGQACLDMLVTGPRKLLLNPCRGTNMTKMHIQVDRITYNACSLVGARGLK